MKSAWPEYWPPEESSTGCVVVVTGYLTSSVIAGIATG